MSAHTITNDSGSIEIVEDVIEQIVRRSAQTVEGTRLRRPRRGLHVQVTDGRAHVELELAVPYGTVVHELGAEVQRRVAEALRGMCGLSVDGVDVSIEELEG
jgi:uncharacterized alkaline shock family protein YloU